MNSLLTIFQSWSFKAFSVLLILGFTAISTANKAQTSAYFNEQNMAVQNSLQTNPDTLDRKNRNQTVIDRLEDPERRLPNTIEFKATAKEMDEAMQSANALSQSEPLYFPKGNGLRILMTGHSWVAPGRKTLPGIALAAGFDGHRQRTHTSGGGSGSANSIWLTEFGKYRDKPMRPILLQAIATGQWDVMTWGSFYNDTPEHYSQWIDACLKYNPDMVFYVQDGWPVFDPSMKDASIDEITKNIDIKYALLQKEMIKDLYDSLNSSYPGKAHVIPAGAAVVKMLHHYYKGELPGFDCVTENLGGSKGIYRDGGHLSINSGMEYLVGYVYYGMLYKKSPSLIKGYLPSEIDPKVDRLMREAAWEAIIQSPFSGVKDYDADGIGNEK